MSKHTPGPWAFNGSANIKGRVNGNDELIALVAAMPCVGGHDDLAAQRGCDMENANIRLIAAAPDLLEALKGVLRVADRATVEFDAARAAIAKAEAA